MVDEGTIPVETLGYTSSEGSSTWFYLPQLSSGTHSIKLQPKPEGASGAFLVDDVVVIGVPRAK
jgi:hypothetical protein